MSTKTDATDQNRTLIQIERDISWGRWILAFVVTAQFGLFWAVYDLKSVTSENHLQLENLAIGQQEMKQEFRILARKLAGEHDVQPDPVFYVHPVEP